MARELEVMAVKLPPEVKKNLIKSEGNRLDYESSRSSTD